MKRNTQIGWKKVASRPLFNLYRSGKEEHLYQVRLTGSGGYLRRRFRAETLEDALRTAPSAGGIAPNDSDSDTILIVQAFESALAQTSRGPVSTRDWLVYVERFLCWLLDKYPGCVYWRLLNRQILREYMATFEGRAANTKRLALQPICQTSGFMHREFGTPNFAERLGIGAKLKSTPKLVYLEDALAFCNYLSAERSWLEAGVALQGLAGLQLQEALRLTWDRVDLDRGLIEIAGEVKNQYRERVIPLAGQVLEALRRENKRPKSSTADGATGSVHVVRGARGERYQEYQSYSRQVRGRLRAWNADLDWTTKDLRNCLPTFAKMHGIHDSLWEQYVGHAPRTVTDRHYIPRLTSRTLGEQGALENEMGILRTRVTDPLDRAISEGGKAEICNFLQSGNERPQDELQVEIT